MAFCNLAGCVGAYQGAVLKLPIDTHSLMPWVEVWFKDSAGRKIGVGNVSSRNNLAVIKSFQFGMSDGAGCNIEIVDEQSGNFARFFQNITTGNAESLCKYTMQFKWGWAKMPCSGQGQTYGSQVSCAATGTEEILQSRPHTMIVKNVNCNVSKGMFKFTVEGTDLALDMIHSRSDYSVGTDKEGVPLVNAIKELLGKHGIKAKFVRLIGACGEGKITWKKDSPCVDFELGMKGRWNALNRDPIQVCRDWLNSTITDKNKGIVTYWDTTATEPTIVFQEVTQPTFEKGFNSNAMGLNVGKYIVNGGHCLDGQTKVLTEDGWNRISNMVKFKYAGKVACVDLRGNVTWRKVNNWYRNLLGDKNLAKVHLRHSRRGGAGIGGGTFTDDHKMLTDMGYVAIKHLDVEKHRIHSGTMRPSEELHQAILGILLGDGYMRAKSHAFSCSHCKDQLCYIEHLALILGLKINTKRNGTTFRITGKASPYWRHLRKLFYPSGKKVINKEILEDFSIISLAYLFMDDGNLEIRKNNRKPRAGIDTCDFTHDEVDLLIDKIKSLGVDCYTRKNEKYPRIYFSVEQTPILSKIVSPYVIKGMDYKILPEHRNIPKKSINVEKIPFYDTFDVMDRSDLKDRVKYVYCVDVEEHHNFITHSGVVHNCSPVISFTPQFNWDIAQIMYLVGGVAGDAQGAYAFKNEEGPEPAWKPEDKKNVDHAGIQNSQYTMEALIQCYGKLVNVIGNRKKLVHQHANLNARPISAELRIQGDPSYNTPILCRGHFVTIVYINPFYLSSDPDPSDPSGRVCKWLSSPPCNDILSNINWMIDGVFHEIREGSYTTTLKLKLPAPGIDIPRPAPLGGSGKTINSCGGAIGLIGGGIASAALTL